MAESFGNEFAIVEVTSGDGCAHQTWLALAKPGQAKTMVLAMVPEGWTAEVLPVVLDEKQQKLFKRANLAPGDIYKIGEV